MRTPDKTMSGRCLVETTSNHTLRLYIYQSIPNGYILNKRLIIFLNKPVKLRHNKKWEIRDYSRLKRVIANSKNISFAAT
jgi:hypothetical protein